MDDLPMKDQIKRLEARRCSALVAGDVAALEQLMADDFRHVHATGLIETRGEYLRTITDRLAYSRIERGDLDIRIFDRAAIVTGLLYQDVLVRATREELAVTAVVTQVWVETEGGWKQASSHACALP